MSRHCYEIHGVLPRPVSSRRLKWTLPLKEEESLFCNPSFSWLHLPSVPGQVHHTIHSRVPLDWAGWMRLCWFWDPLSHRVPQIYSSSSTPAVPTLSQSMQHIPTASCSKKPLLVSCHSSILFFQTFWTEKKKTYKRVIMSWGHNSIICDLWKRGPGVQWRGRSHSPEVTSCKENSRKFLCTTWHSFN